MHVGGERNPQEHKEFFYFFQLLFTSQNFLVKPFFIVLDLSQSPSPSPRIISLDSLSEAFPLLRLLEVLLKGTFFYVHQDARKEEMMRLVPVVLEEEG
ncbi:hypothetical protein VNO77_27310 [Canavalia gladiata]|uniref:Uncharacterized protein n=1 Tax=Canavalia gladiata TaxID=3824 RepID=A0AAN9KTX1_CANGL